MPTSPQNEDRVPRATHRHADRVSQHIGSSLGPKCGQCGPCHPLQISLANAEGREALPLQEGGDATASKALTNTSVCRRRPQHRHQNVAQVVHKDHEPTPESCKIEYTRDTVFNTLERPVADPSLDCDNDSEFELTTGSRGSADLHARLNTRCPQLKQ